MFLSEKNLIQKMQELATEAIEITGFFHNGKKLYSNVLREEKANIRDFGGEQRGVIRVNCVDSLDRTNAAQFFIGKCALGFQVFLV